MTVSNINRTFTTAAAAALLATFFLGGSFATAAPVPPPAPHSVAEPHSIADKLFKIVGKASAYLVAPILPHPLIAGIQDVDRHAVTGAPPKYNDGSLLYQVGTVVGTVGSTVGPDSRVAGAVEGTEETTGL
ncbi:hypothetical protein EC957_005913 [Mortierella hygrophila]|uniref:Uncharacterized protein n=1 Tax=Mortierella hygrophila TaxID=979708 RepID=A0A9P6FEY0_9FUNG|nr:hypothetical protein EC957_005913 [Mortierella hygrophila]